MILTEDKILYSDEGKSLIEKTDEYRYAFKKAFMPPGTRLDECVERFEEIDDTTLQNSEVQNDE